MVILPSNSFTEVRSLDKSKASCKATNIPILPSLLKLVFEAISLQRPVVTGNSSAIREIFEGGKNIFLVEMANPKALAEAILKLKSNQTLYFEMARNGYRLFEEKFKPRIIVKDLATCIFNEINPHF